MNLTFMIKYIMEVNMPNLNLNDNNLIIVCPTCHKEIHLKDNPELSQYLQEY